MTKIRRPALVLPEFAPLGHPRQADKVDMNVGCRLRERREELGLSKTAIARAIGVTLAQVAKYENGTNRIAAARLHKLAELLDVPVEWFFAMPATPGAGVLSPPVDPAQMAHRLMVAYRRIASAVDRRRLVALAEELARKAD